MSAFDEAMGLSPEALDQADIGRHVLGLTILPTTVQEIGARFAEAKRGGAKLPSERAHADVADVGATLTKLEGLGLVEKVSGFASFEKMIKASDKSATLVNNNQDPEDSPHADGAYFQTQTRGALWAENMTNADASLDGTYWQMTKDGFRLLTGHDQGEDKAIRAANEAALAAAPAVDEGGAE